jgi:hypothetical protein
MMSEEQEIVRHWDVDTEEVAQLWSLILFGSNSGVRGVEGISESGYCRRTAFSRFFAQVMDVLRVAMACIVR